MSEQPSPEEGGEPPDKPAERPWKRSFFAPEVVQTSSMDCGPATLKALLDGHGIPVSYGRLREACQTDVDGTSIDVMEDVANRLGLEAEQKMLPLDHLLHPESKAMPSLLVVALPDGSTHFVVLWRVFAGFVQLMDPGTGRRWMTTRAFLSEVYIHTQPVPVAGWRDEWAASDDFTVVLLRRMRALGVAGRSLVDAALADPGWVPIAALDAATRMVEALATAGGVPRGPAAAAMLTQLARAAAADPDGPVPASFWSVRPHPDVDGEPMVLMRGAVLVYMKRRPEGHTVDTADLEPELAAALQDPQRNPVRELAAMLGRDAVLPTAFILVALVAATFGAMLQTVLFRGLLDLVGQLGLVEQRLAGIAALATFAAALVLLELPIASLARSLGRGLEYRLRAAFLRKIPRLGDRYLQSRPNSDMAQRSHSAHAVRTLPEVATRAARALLRLGATAAGLIWLDPASAPTVVIAVILAVAVPLALQGPLVELDLRFRTHAGSLSRFYLDAMLGLVAIRTHGAERSLRRAHEQLLVDWARAGRASLSVVVTAEVVQGLVAVALAAWLFVGWLTRAGDAAAALLVVYWALELPAIGLEIGQYTRLYPALRNITLRMLEPLGAIEEGDGAGPVEGRTAADQGVDLALSGVTVRAAGHTILEAVDLHVRPGEHVAIVGPSGAGKSSLVGLLLGWHRVAAGELRVDGDVLAGDRLARLRQETAWVDPAVQLWNRSLHANLGYGNEGQAVDLGPVMNTADLVGVLQKLPDGLQQVLGEGGGLLSGGEGQRVRLGRALIRQDARLVILDEPFRGLDREKRRTLLTEARRWWERSTLLCVTHDVGETVGFSRVIVVEGGKVVEDAPPGELAARPDSRYRALLDAEEEVRSGLWNAARWRRLRLAGGRLVEGGRG